MRHYSMNCSITTSIQLDWSLTVRFSTFSKIQRKLGQKQSQEAYATNYTKSERLYWPTIRNYRRLWAGAIVNDLKDVTVVTDIPLINVNITIIGIFLNLMT